MTTTLPTAANMNKYSPSNAPIPQVSANSHGAGVGKAVAGFGAAGFDLADKLAGQEAMDAAMKADVELSDAVRLSRFGDPEGNTPGFESLEGHDALAARAGAEAKLQTEFKRISSGLTDRARRRFEKTGRGRLGLALDGFAAHADRQRIVATKKASAAMIDAAHQDVIADPSNATEHINLIREEARRLYTSMYGDPLSVSDPDKAGKLLTLIDNEVDREVTKAHVGAINGLLVNDAAAQAYYDDNINEIDPNVRAKLLKGIQTGSRLKAAQTFVGTLNADLTSEDGRKTARDAVRAKFSGEDKKVTMAELKTRIAETTADHTLGQKELRLSAIDKIESGRDREITPEERASMLETPGGATYLLTGPQKVQDIKAGRTKRPDVPLEAQLVKMDDAELSKVDLTEGKWVSGLGTNHNYWLKQQKASLDRLRDGAGAGRTPTQIRAAAAKTIKSDKQAAQFGARFDEELAALTAGKPDGFKPPATEVQKIADRLTLELRRERDAFSKHDGSLSDFTDSILSLDETAKLFNIAPEQVPQYAVDDVEANYRKVSRILGIPETAVGQILKRLKVVVDKATLARIAKAYKDATQK